jgi:isopropylmalate/homocitrate/citramalate synthase
MHERFRLSPYNLEAQPVITHRAHIVDCTLREGEQSADVFFSFKDRCQIAGALSKTGVERLQVGFSGPDLAKEVDDLKRVAEPVQLEMLILAFRPDWRQQIDLAVAAGVSHLNIIYRSSPVLLNLLGATKEELVETSVAAVSYAKSLGSHVIYSPTDTTRAEWTTLKQIYPAVVEAGADAVYVLDTGGVATPHAIKYLVKKIKHLTGLPVGIHTHNDFGLALANALAAYAAGADLIDTCVNGMGDRCGNPSLDEIAVALELLHGCSSGIKLEQMSALSALVAKLSGSPISASKPITGANAFAQTLDIHLQALTEDPLTYQPFLPEMVGNRARIVIGKNTGRFALKTKLSELGVNKILSDNELHKALKMIKQLAMDKKRSLYDEEIITIIAQV